MIFYNIILYCVLFWFGLLALLIAMLRPSYKHQQLGNDFEFGVQTKRDDSLGTVPIYAYFNVC